MNESTHDLTLIEMGFEHPRSAHVAPLSTTRLAQAKLAYTPRRVPVGQMATLLSGDLKPRAGDLVLARVTRTRQHGRLELASGRRASLYEGDDIIVCYGNRYAPDQFEALVPANLGPCHLVAAGGIAARMLCKHSKIKAPTEITPVGLIGDHRGRRLNLADWTVARKGDRHPRPLTVAVVGTSMNAGKTTSAAYLARGLARSGLKVGAAKITGTGAGGDVWAMKDAGVHEAVDFTDAGLASTYCAPAKQVQEIATTLINHLQAGGAEAIVLELADGLFQQETAALIKAPCFTSRIDGIVFAAADAMGAAAGVQWLQRYGINVLGVSGVLTASPLAIRETEEAVDLPVLDKDALMEPGAVANLARQSPSWATAEAV